MSSSLTILMTCCAGFSAPETSAPVARSLIRAMNARTTGSATSASSRAMRISRQVASMSCRGQPALAAEVGEDRGKPVGQGFEHLVGLTGFGCAWVDPGHCPASRRRSAHHHRCRRQAQQVRTGRRGPPRRSPGPAPRTAPSRPRPARRRRRRPRRRGCRTRAEITLMPSVVSTDATEYSRPGMSWARTSSTVDAFRRTVDDVHRRRAPPARAGPAPLVWPAGPRRPGCRPGRG